MSELLIESISPDFYQLVDGDCVKMGPRCSEDRKTQLFSVIDVYYKAENGF